MGNQKLRLSNIIPNVWFNKLKEMTTNSNSSSKIIRKPHHTTKGTTNLEPCTPPPSLPRKSYHFTRNLNSKSSSARKTRPTTKSPSSVSTACSCATATAHSVQSKPASTTTTTTCSSLDNLSLPPELHCFDRMVAWSSTSCNGSSTSPLPDDDDHIHSDVVIGVDKMSLAPIITEHKKFSDLVREIGAAEEEQTDTDDKPKIQRRGPVRHISTSSGSPRVRIRINSPRLSKRFTQVESNAAGRNRRRKSVKWSSSESVAVLKSSADPERDFRESMVEMIVENQIRAAKDLEDLLASYLSLNSAEYHRLIIQVFQQIWFGLNQIH